MIKIKSLGYLKALFAVMATVLFIRSFGVLVLNQHSPASDTFEKHQLTKKSISIWKFKKDLPPIVLQPGMPQKSQLPAFSHIEFPVERLLDNTPLTSTLLRSPPVSGLAVR